MLVVLCTPLLLNPPPRIAKLCFVGVSENIVLTCPTSAIALPNPHIHMSSLIASSFYPWFRNEAVEMAITPIQLCHRYLTGSSLFS